MQTFIGNYKNKMKSTTDVFFAEVKKTNNYKLFNNIVGNRTIRAAHKKKLIESFKVKQLPIPIIVNSKYEIIDGQHRFEVCKELNLYVYYIIIKNADLTDIQRINENMQKWNPNDYLDCYISLNISNYYKYRDFRKKYKFNHNETLTLLYDGENARYSGACQDFRNGSLKISNLKKSIETAEKILKTEPHYDGCRRRYFVLALIECFKNKEYDHCVFLNKISKQSAKMQDQSSTKDYLKLIEKIYNYKSRSKIRLFTY